MFDLGTPKGNKERDRESLFCKKVLYYLHMCEICCTFVPENKKFIDLREL